MREALIEKRKAKGLTRVQMAAKCKCTERLIVGIEEDDWITHPKIAAWLAKGYGFGIRMFNQLVHEDRREKVLPEPEEPPKLSNWAWDAHYRNDKPSTGGKRPRTRYK